MKCQPIHKSLKAICLLIFCFISLLYSCKKDDIKLQNADEESAAMVYDWYKFAAQMQLMVTPRPGFQLLHRNFGYIGVGLYESVRPGINGSVSLASRLYQMPSMPEIEQGKNYLWSASANAALASMFKQFLTGLTDANNASIDSMETAINNRLKASAATDVISRSQAFGRSIATVIYNWSTTDNFSFTGAGTPPPGFPGAWVPTPPNFAVGTGASLKDSRPFLEYSLTATAPPLPFPYSENPASEFYKAAKEVYDIGKTLTTEQKAIADWWADVGGAGVGLPAPYHTLTIITNVLECQQVGLGQVAEVYAKTGIAMKDGPIVVFRAKYQYYLLRPVTYIKRHIDPTWQSYLPSPPYPEYPSGIMSVYGPVVQVLIREVGDIPVIDDAYSWRGVAPRRFSSLSKLAEEVAYSRVYAGIHYRFTQDISTEIGKQLGNQIADIN